MSMITHLQSVFHAIKLNLLQRNYYTYDFQGCGLTPQDEKKLYLCSPVNVLSTNQTE